VHHEISHPNPAEFRQVRAFFWNDGSVTKRVPEDAPRILVFCCGDLELVDLPSGNLLADIQCFKLVNKNPRNSIVICVP